MKFGRQDTGLETYLFGLWWNGTGYGETKSLQISLAVWRWQFYCYIARPEGATVDQKTSQDAPPAAPAPATATNGGRTVLGVVKAILALPGAILGVFKGGK